MFAGRIAGQSQPVATRFGRRGVRDLPHFDGLVYAIEDVRHGCELGLRSVLVAPLVGRRGQVLGALYLDDPGTIAIAVPVITVLGTSLGLAYQRTGHKLSTSVAMHFWYDFLLSAFAFAADPNHQVFVVNYSSPM